MLTYRVKAAEIHFILMTINMAVTVSHWRSQEFVLRGLENRGACAEFETPGVERDENVKGVSSSPADRGSGERGPS